MKKTYRIKKYSEIDAVFKKRKVKSDHCFAVYYACDPEAKHFRFAMSIGKKYGNAVERNLAKRRIRMIVSECKDQFGDNKLILIVIKPQAKTLNYQEMRAQLLTLFKKLRLTEKENAETL